MLDVTRLRVLVAVARHGSVTAAARALNYAQPSVSHHLARLEAETGTKLVQRAGRGIRLTEAEPPEAVRMLRAGYVDVALVFRHEPEGDGPADRSGDGAAADPEQGD